MYSPVMRTTLTIDDDVLAAAREVASAQSRPLGAVLSELARRGLQPGSRLTQGDFGFPVIKGGRPITAEDVAAALDEE